MKRVFITLFCLSVTAVAATAQDKSATPTQVNTTPVAAPPPPAAKPVDPDAGEFKFKNDTHNFGEVPEGPLAECEFEFKNVGKKPIVINEAHGSCGCTVPKWPQEPIMPGKKGVIHVAYTTQGRQGPISKEITINSNAKQSPMVLHIRGTVKPKPAEPAAAPAQAPAQGH